jgi:uncharacterized protein
LTGGRARDPRIDALRGLALAGILLVNIQSYLWGAVNPIGFLAPGASAPDRAAHFLTAAFVAGKIMPLFGLLFGGGFSLLLGKLVASVAAPVAVYRRRLAFLLVVGIAHGVFLYFADITHTYALAGFVLLLYADASAAALARATVRWWMFAAAWALLLSLPSLVDNAVPVDWLEEARLDFEISARLGYVDQWPVRIGLFTWQAQANLLGLPNIVALMMTGMLAHRAGWLADLDAPAWNRATALGLGVGMPAALGYGLWCAAHPGLEDSLVLPAWVLAMYFAGQALAFFYAAAFLRHAPESIIRWLAPAGRMPLTNYLLQSVAMGVLLSGWGLAWGADANYAQLSGLAIVVFALQVVASRWWLARHAQGPLEALWRAWTYRNAAPSETRA